MPQTFYLFRHALATKSMHGYGSQIKTAEILPEGIPVIKKLAEFLKTVGSDYNVSSEYLRCRQTAAIVTQISGKMFAFDSRLNEFDGEETKEFIDRVQNFLLDMESKQYKNVVICTHAGVITVILKTFQHQAIHASDLLTNYPQPGVLLALSEGKVTEKDFNQP